MIHGVIDRCILVNYRVDPAVLATLLPAPFWPKLVRGQGIAGICLIRLIHLRPRGLPANAGVASANAAHRIAVEWDEQGQTREGVFIPRRDTASRLNTWLGGRVVPGFHEHARFHVLEAGRSFSVALQSDDAQTRVRVEAELATALAPTSVFERVDEVSGFFAHGAVGYSPGRVPGLVQGIRLHAFNWQMLPLAVRQVESSFFDDPGRFPPGSRTFDCAMLMSGIEHEWLAEPAPGGGARCVKRNAGAHRRQPWPSAHLPPAPARLKAGRPRPPGRRAGGASRPRQPRLRGPARR